MMYQRSADMFLGVPFNVFSYSVLTYIIAIKCDLKPDKLHIIFGDTHIYKDHILAMKEQISRFELCRPVLNINKNVKNKDWKDLDISDFEIIGYFPHSPIRGKMSI
jgi:thymidylate synthase